MTAVAIVAIVTMWIWFATSGTWVDAVSTFDKFWITLFTGK
jgi:hypothetical protein